MSRKPYLPTYQSYNYAIGIGQIDQRPQFVAAIGRCVASWSFVEHQLAILLGVILKAENEAAIAVFSKLRRSSGQREAIDAASRNALDERDRRLLSAILNVVSAIEKERNDLVHGHWGIIADREDVATWIEGEHHSVWNTKVLTSEDRGIHVGHDELRKHLFVYILKDLDDIYIRINEVWTILFDFIGYVRRSEAKGMFGFVGDQLFEYLSKLPRVADALVVLDRRKQAS